MLNDLFSFFMIWTCFVDVINLNYKPNIFKKVAIYEMLVILTTLFVIHS